MIAARKNNRPSRSPVRYKFRTEETMSELDNELDSLLVPGPSTPRHAYYQVSDIERAHSMDSTTTSLDRCPSVSTCRQCGAAGESQSCPDQSTAYAVADDDSPARWRVTFVRDHKHRRRRRGPSPTHPRTWNVCRRFKLRPENLLLVFTLLAVVVGTCVGMALNPHFRGEKLTTRELRCLGFAGQLFLRMLKLLIVPMVISSNVSSIASVSGNAARLLACLSVTYMITTTVIAVLTGIILVLVIEPGGRKESQQDHVLETGEMLEEKSGYKLLDSVFGLVRNLVPENLMSATFQREHFNISSSSSRIEHAYGTNILGLICFSIMFGIAVRNLQEEASIIADLFHCIRRAMVYLVSIVMWLSPIGIMSLIAENIAVEGKLIESISKLSLYTATVMAGLVVHGVIILPFLLYIFTRKSPLQYLSSMSQALVCAAGTASSTATLPSTIRCLEKGGHVDPRVTRFMLPLGTTINMNGTAMYEAIAVIYIAQSLDVQLNVGDVVMVGLASTLAGMSAASMPSAGILTMTMVLMTVGIPGSATSLILPVDWFLDRFRTMVNVYGDAVGAAIVSRLCESRLAQEYGPPDPSKMSDPADAIVECPGGLLDVDLKECEEINDSILPQDCFAIDSPVRFNKLNGDVPMRVRQASLVGGSHIELGNVRLRGASIANPEAVRAEFIRAEHPSIPEELADEKTTVAVNRPVPNSQSACVYVIDEDTVVLKF